MQFWQPCRKLSTQSPKIFCSNFEENFIIIIFFQSSSLAEDSSGQAKCSFVSTAKKFCVKVFAKILDFPRKRRGCSSGHVECSCDNAAENFLLKIRRSL